MSVQRGYGELVEDEYLLGGPGLGSCGHSGESSPEPGQRVEYNKRGAGIEPASLEPFAGPRSASKLPPSRSGCRDLNHGADDLRPPVLRYTTPAHPAPGLVLGHPRASVETPGQTCTG